jgi:GT2 family glycosyltransferase
MSTPRLTIGIPSCGRPEKLGKCLSSCVETVGEPTAVIIVESMPNDESRQLARNYHATLIEFDSPVGPARARFEIGKKVETELLLYTDDDLIARQGAIQRMLAIMDAHSNIDILGATWAENGGFRESGQLLAFNVTLDEKRVSKTMIYPDDLGAAGSVATRVDITMATMLVRTSVLERVAFDPRYDFYFELFDFGMQCREKGIHLYCTHLAVFDHNPHGYQGSTLRSAPRERDLGKFVGKWGYHPVGPLGGGVKKAKVFRPGKCE